MAHLVTSTDKVLTVHQPPWWGLGINLPDYVSAEEVKQLVCPWEPMLRNLYTEDGTPVSHRATVRSDTGDVLGVVGPNYKVFSNKDAFDFFIRVTNHPNIQLETAGTLDGGRRLWLLAKTGQFDVTSEQDTVEEHLLLSTSHDGSLAVRALWTPVRVVCNNTLTSALKEGIQTGFKARHTTNVMSKVSEAADLLGLARKHHEQTQTAYEQLANTYPSEEEIQEVLERLFPEREDAQRDTWTEPRCAMRELYDASETCNLPGMEGTAWSLYNAATEYSDWYRRENQSDEKRWLSATEGAGSEFKEQAFAYCLAL